MGKINLPCKFGDNFELYYDLVNGNKLYKKGIFVSVTDEPAIFGELSYRLQHGKLSNQWDSFEYRPLAPRSKRIFVTPFQDIIYDCPFTFGSTYDVSLYFPVKSKFLEFRSVGYDPNTSYFVYYFLDRTNMKWHYLESNVMLGFYIESILINEHNPKGAGRKNKFTDDIVLSIIEKVKNGSSYRSLSKEFSCSIGLISKLVSEYNII